MPRRPTARYTLPALCASLLTPACGEGRDSAHAAPRRPAAPTPIATTSARPPKAGPARPGPRPSAGQVATGAGGSLAAAAPRPNFDAYQASAQQAKASGVRRAGQTGPRLKAGAAALGAPGVVASVDDLRGTPTVIWSARLAPAPGAVAAGPAAAARAHLKRYAASYGLSDSIIRDAVVTHVHDTGRGAIIVRFGQRIDGVDVYRSGLKVVMNRAYQLVALSGSLRDDARVSKKTATAFAIAPGEAVARALSDRYGIAVGAAALQKSGSRAGADLYAATQPLQVTGGTASLLQPARTQRVYYALADRLVPAWSLDLELASPGSDRPEAYHYVISAEDGSLLSRQYNTLSEAFSYRVWADASGDHRPADGPTADSTPYPGPAPDGFEPAFIAPSLIAIDAFNHNPNGTSDTWLPAGATDTNGNNVDAYADDASPEGFSTGDVRATITAPGVFGHLFDPTQDPTASTAQTMGSVTQLFYVNNWLHDYFYDSGFNETAGVGQASNYGRGGLEGDPLQAEAQFGNGQGDFLNNAFMNWFPEGTPPRMQMYLWSAPEGQSARRDGSVDNMIVSHEWGHYLHLRLLDGCTSTQCYGESEGWADFVALHMMLREGDDLDAAYGMGNWAIRLFTPNWAYFGIRRFPYSVDFTKNASTLRHIRDGEQLPNVPLTDGSFGGGPIYSDWNFEPHNVGEIWASALFEGYIALLKESQGPSPRYTFAEARRRMADYVVAGILAAPNDPTLIEQRDAILAAAAASDSQDALLLAQGFARRGFGSQAIAPDRFADNGLGTVEDFNLAAGLTVSATVQLGDDCDGDGIVDQGEAASVQIRITNIGASALSSATASVTASVPQLGFPDGNSLTFPTIPAFGEATLTLPIAVAAGAPSGLVDLAVTATDPAANALGTGSLRIRINSDLRRGVARLDDVESATPVWTTDEALGSPWRRVASDAPGGSNVWFGANGETETDLYLVSPPLAVSSTEPFVLSFRHRYNMEYTYDGGVIELSTDGGASWQDITTWAPAGYTLGIEGATVLSGRQAYSGLSPAWPAFSEQQIDLGTQLAGQTVRLRFRAASDISVLYYGWELDDIQLSGIDGTPFPGAGDEDGVCPTGVRPVAVAGADQVAVSGATVGLDASGSSDADGDPLSYEWIQVSGPIATLDDAHAVTPHFTAPAVDVTRQLTFALLASDGQGDSSPDTVIVTVQPDVVGTPDAGVDAAPPAPDAGPDAGADAGIDAATPAPDAGADAGDTDAGIPQPPEEGCGCRTSDSSSGRGSALLVLFVGGAVVFGRRRRRR